MAKAVPKSVFQVTSADAITKAIARFDELKRDTFIKLYGFRRSREFFIKHEERYYDSKPIVGLAFALQHKGRAPLRANEFGGGESTVRPVLERLGFVVRRLDKEQRQRLVGEVDVEEGEDDEPPHDAASGWRKVQAFVKRRLGQAKFRDALMSAYDSRCAISGDNVAYVLEAAHIKPFADAGLNAVSNGLLLRADLHLLFDHGLIAVDEYSRVLVSEDLGGTPYAKFRGKPLRPPQNKTHNPNREALRVHRANSMAG